jgi:guanylate kinase
MLVKERRDVGYSVSCTTRTPRNGEVDGRDYHFLDLEEFARRRDAGEFAEWAVVHGNLYGTLRSEVERVLTSGCHVVMDIDVRGAAQFKAAFPESVRVFVLPPSAEVLVARLKGRQTEVTDEVAERLRRALDELREVHEYEYVIVNDDLGRAFAQVSSIIEAEAVRHARLPSVTQHVSALVADLGHHLSTHH